MAPVARARSPGVALSAGIAAKQAPGTRPIDKKHASIASGRPNSAPRAPSAVPAYPAMATR